MLSLITILSISAPVDCLNLSNNVPLGILNSLANDRTTNVGDGNYDFKFNGDFFRVDEENKDKKLVKVLANEDSDSGIYELECYEISAGILFGTKEIILKNASQSLLKIEVKYPTVDYAKDEDDM